VEKAGDAIVVVCKAVVFERFKDVAAFATDPAETLRAVLPPQREEDARKIPHMAAVKYR